MLILNEPLARAPAVVFPAARVRGQLHVYLFAGRFAYVADEHVERDRVEAGSPRIAQTIAENLLSNWGGGAKEWIIERDGVAPVVFDVDTQDFSEQGLRALGVAKGKPGSSGSSSRTPPSPVQM
jgi:hypothetical protein